MASMWNMKDFKSFFFLNREENLRENSFSRTFEENSFDRQVRKNTKSIKYFDNFTRK